MMNSVQNVLQKFRGESGSGTNGRRREGSTRLGQVQVLEERTLLSSSVQLVQLPVPAGFPAECTQSMDPEFEFTWVLLTLVNGVPVSENVQFNYDGVTSEPDYSVTLSPIRIEIPTPVHHVVLPTIGIILRMWQVVHRPRGCGISRS